MVVEHIEQAVCESPEKEQDCDCGSYCQQAF
jgi:hypothetical protein